MTIVIFILSILSFLMLIAAAAAPIARLLKLPQPVLFAALGLFIGLGITLFGREMYQGALDKYQHWFVDQLALDTSAILHVFLPPLLFEMALVVNLRRLVGDAPAVLTMAIVAVAITTVAVGASTWALTPIEAAGCLLLGAAVATTDPGAVISTFREIGAPKRLLSILEGESLLNDAAAIAIFGLLIGILTQDLETTPFGLTINFLSSFGAGASIGVLTASLAILVYPYLARSSAAETSVTVAVAYLAFIVAELFVGASGVVSVVFAGLTTGHMGFLRMGPGNWNTVRVVWSQIGFWANALITIIAASLVPALILEAGWRVIPITILAYLGAMVARTFIVLGLIPAMAKIRLTTSLTRPQAYVAIWGGVRGSVTLVLALSIADIQALGTDAPLLAASAACFTLVTIFLNASSLAWFTERLGLNQLSRTDLALRERIAAGALERVRSVIGDVARSRHLEPEAIIAVETSLGARQEEVEAIAEKQAGGTEIPRSEQIRAGLAIASGQEARLIRRAFEEGMINAATARSLRFESERIADAGRLSGEEGYKKASQAALAPNFLYKTAVLVQRLFRIDWLLRRSIEQHFITLLELERIIKELMDFTNRSIEPMIGRYAAVDLLAILKNRYELVETEVDAISAQYPTYALEVEKALIARVAIRRERQQYRRLLSDGVIGDELHDSLSKNLDDRERQSTIPPRLDLTITPRQMLDRLTMFQNLENPQKRMLARKLKSRFTIPGELIQEDNSKAKQMYFIASGAFEIIEEGQKSQLATGDFFGDFLTDTESYRRPEKVISLGYCKLLWLSQGDFEKLQKRHPNLNIVNPNTESQYKAEISAKNLGY